MPPQQNIRIAVAWYVPAIIAGGLVLSAIVGSYTLYAARSLDNVLSVTGSAKARVTADSVKWTLTISRKATEYGLPGSYPLLENDIKAVKTFLTSNGIPESSISVSPVSVNEMYNYNNPGGPSDFNLAQTVTVQSKDVVAVDVLAKGLGSLTAKGVFVSSNYLEFFVSALPEYRVSLLGDALKDARARATEIAKASGQGVGRLKAASSGVVQVLAPNSIEISDYGQYDTQSIEKDISVTVRATFFVR